MHFFSLSLWYVLIALNLILTLLTYLVTHNNWAKKEQLVVGLVIAFWILLIFNSIFVGWISGMGIFIGLIGGIAIIVLYFLVIVPVANRLSFMVFKLTHPKAKFLTYKRFKVRNAFKLIGKKPSDLSSESVMKRKREMNRRLLEMKNSPYVKVFFISLGEEESKIDEIYWSLMSSGAGEYVACSVVYSPVLITEYLTLEKSGYSKREIANEFVDGLGW